ncbi:hypothetical protein BDV26DRAFT_294283 [Aspergillus bertholletiae]|uniref:Uncharacterized protein n=1 Tax=Aspergillus bertholletiae TaxID=1226010 RepID=A0A5N7B2D1_9EURO|nr:hypothetical protein BDV26DRAFT_294283 [Aspergillus bertholletiae]
MGGVPLNTFKKIKESLKSIFKKKKKADKDAQAAEQNPEDAAAGEATTDAAATHEASAAESQDAAPAATGLPQSTPGISPGTSIPEQAQNNDHEAPAPTPLPQIPPIETTESAAHAETPAAGLAVETTPAEPTKPEAK